MQPHLMKYGVKKTEYAIKGSVLIEATLIVNLIVIIIFGALAINSQIRQKQKLNNILRNVSVEIVKDCTRKLIRNEPDAESCVKIAMNNTINQKSELNNDFSIRVSNYSNVSGDTELIFSSIMAPASSSLANETSRFTVEKINDNFQELIDSTTHITIVEVYMLNSNTILPFKEHYFGAAKILEGIVVF